MATLQPRRRCVTSRPLHVMAVGGWISLFACSIRIALVVQGLLGSVVGAAALLVRLIALAYRRVQDRHDRRLAPAPCRCARSMLAGWRRVTVAAIRAAAAAVLVSSSISVLVSSSISVCAAARAAGIPPILIHAHHPCTVPASSRRGRVLTVPACIPLRRGRGRGLAAAAAAYRLDEMIHNHMHTSHRQRTSGFVDGAIAVADVPLHIAAAASPFTAVTVCVPPMPMRPIPQVSPSLFVTFTTLVVGI